MKLTDLFENIQESSDSFQWDADALYDLQYALEGEASDMKADQEGYISVLAYDEHTDTYYADYNIIGDGQRSYIFKIDTGGAGPYPYDIEAYEGSAGHSNNIVCGFDEKENFYLANQESV